MKLMTVFVVQEKGCFRCLHNPAVGDDALLIASKRTLACSAASRIVGDDALLITTPVLTGTN